MAEDNNIRMCADCNERPAAKHRTICWKCKKARHTAKHGLAKKPKKPVTKICTVKGCESICTSNSSGVCSLHYHRMKRNGTYELLPKKEYPRPCQYCESPIESGITCSRCANARRIENADECAVDGCGKPGLCKNPIGKVCKAHDKRFKRHGSFGGGRVSNGVPVKWLEDNIKTCNENECLLWPFGKDSNGYGSMVGRSNEYGINRSHRLALVLATGEVGEVARHKCRNRSCCNPHHLEWGTYKENSHDRFRDETNGVKLTKSDVIAILSSDDSGPILAERFGVCVATISKIRLRKTWKHVELPYQNA